MAGPSSQAMFRCASLSEVEVVAPFGIGVSSNRISATRHWCGATAIAPLSDSVPVHGPSHADCREGRSRDQERRGLVHIKPAAEIRVDLLARRTVVIGWAFGGSVCVFMSAGWFRLTRSVAKQGIVRYSAPKMSGPWTPSSGILCPGVPFVPQRYVPSPVPTSVKVETVLAALKRRKKTRTGPIVVVMLEVILTRATAKLKLGCKRVVVWERTRSPTPPRPG